MTDLGLFLAGVVIGAYGVVIGGGMYLAIPLFELVAPAANLGQIVGNIKVGSIARGISSTWTTLRLIAVADGLRLAVPFVAGTLVGAAVITSLGRIWLLPALLLTIALSELAPRLRHPLGRAAFDAASFAVGIFAGLLGAGLALILVALLRLREGADARIVAVKIQARFVEVLVTAAAILTHFVAGNLTMKLWVPWSLGSLVGGALGGAALARLVAVPARVQKALLRFSYVAAFAGTLASLRW